MMSNDEESSRPRAIIAGHGDFPSGIVSAVQQISGRGDAFLALSNRDLSGEDIEQRLREYVEKEGIRVFFTDLPAGSATLAVRRMMRSDPQIVLVTGANLATLLDFVFETSGDPAECAKRAAEKGKAALATFGGGT
jgi:PTS system N-acetylgalactosamine-specific IIA component